MHSVISPPPRRIGFFKFHTLPELFSLTNNDRSFHLPLYGFLTFTGEGRLYSKLTVGRSLGRNQDFGVLDLRGRTYANFILGSEVYICVGRLWN